MLANHRIFSVLLCKGDLEHAPCLSLFLTSLITWENELSVIRLTCHAVTETVYQDHFFSNNGEY